MFKFMMWRLQTRAEYSSGELCIAILESFQARCDMSGMQIMFIPKTYMQK